jgi:hypothetical protein
MTKTFLFSGLLLTLATSSCGLGLIADATSGGESGLSTTRESYSYSFEFNGCKTGTHRFNSKAAMCNGLKSQSRNNYCAVGMRESYFISKGCPGIFETEI